MRLPPLGVCLALVACLAAGGCKQDGGRSYAQRHAGDFGPKSEIFALIDLSETWHNPTSDPHNRDVLLALGEGISMAAPELEGPIDIQYRSIGAQSLQSPPLCHAFYKQTLITTAGEKPKNLVTKLKSLKQYLSKDCRKYLLTRPPEGLTEISAAVASVANEPRTAGVPRAIIIASDFFEESFAIAPLGDANFKDVSVMILYRPLPEDQANPASMRMRVEMWADVLRKQGATVVLQPDTALRPDQVASFLLS